jgi:hypothetical protein
MLGFGDERQHAGGAEGSASSSRSSVGGVLALGATAAAFGSDGGNAVTVPA